MSEFEIRYETEADEQSLTAINQDTWQGFLTYSADKTNPGSYEITLLRNLEYKQEIALRLVQEMVRRVGPGVSISAVIIHDGTIDYFNEHGIIDNARNHGGLEITEPETLRNFPIVRGLRIAGIATESISIQFETEGTDQEYDLHLNGKTVSVDISGID
jgi:hypothetical protein